MSLTGVITKPLLRGTVANAGPWQALCARPGLRVYPFKVGCAVLTDTDTGTVYTSGLGQIAFNDYLIPCRQVYYGDSALYVPDITRITRVTAVAADNDQLTVSPAQSLQAGEWLLNIGADTALTPLVDPNLDGAGITLYTDPAGTLDSGLDYTMTGQGGMFQAWLPDTYALVDVLLTDEDGTPIVAMPLYPLGPGVVTV